MVWGSNLISPPTHGSWVVLVPFVEILVHTPCYTMSTLSSISYSCVHCSVSGVLGSPARYFRFCPSNTLLSLLCHSLEIWWARSSLIPQECFLAHLHPYFSMHVYVVLSGIVLPRPQSNLPLPGILPPRPLITTKELCPGQWYPPDFLFIRTLGLFLTGS